MPQQLSTTLVSQAVFSRALHYFVRVATVGSIREASRQLNVSPSAVSRQIQLLQARLDVPLFYNLGNTLRLSPAGGALLDYCNDVNDTLDDAVNRISALSGNYTGTLRIATVDSFANHAFADLLSGFSRQYPGIRVIASVAAAQEVARNVRSGDADIGFTFGIADEDILARLFTLHCPTRIVVSRDHPLADRGKIDFEDCLDYSVALLSPSTNIRQELETVSTRAGARWPRCIETNSFSLLQRLALGGQFVIFQPEYPGASGTIPNDRLVFHAVEARLPAPTEEFAMIVDRRVHQSAARTCFVDYAKAFLADLGTPS
ncbi:MAG: LysR family transcriptional regulator [Rhodobacteraceae bacterium]|nr:LysR family transcriptional regulator [Paracoccaceae bacterium]